MLALQAAYTLSGDDGPGDGWRDTLDRFVDSSRWSSSTRNWSCFFSISSSRLRRWTGSFHGISQHRLYTVITGSAGNEDTKQHRLYTVITGSSGNEDTNQHRLYTVITRSTGDKDINQHRLYTVITGSAGNDDTNQYRLYTVITGSAGNDDTNQHR